MNLSLVDLVIVLIIFNFRCSPLGWRLCASATAQVRNKSWFGVLNVLTLLVRDWTVLREASSAILLESNGEAPSLL
jgi:hypothetical protein